MKNVALQKQVDDFRKQGAYVHEISSFAKLETGKPIQRVKIFTGKQSEPFGVDYRESGSNPFESGRGSILAIRQFVVDNVGADVNPSGGSTDTARHTQLSRLINTLTFEIQKGAYPKHKGTMRSAIDQLPPHIYRPALENSSSPTNIVRPFALHQRRRELQNVAGYGDYPLFFRSPLSWEKLDETLDFILNTRDNTYVVDAELNDHYIGTTMLIVEDPKRG